MKYFLVGLLLGGYLFFVHLHGFPTPDESWFLQAGSRMLHGEVPYRDFQFIYFPGAVYINVLGFNIFGVSVFASRVMALFNSLAAVGTFWWLGKNRGWSKTLIASVCALFVFWGPTHINFVWPVMFCITTGLLTAVAFIKAEKDEKREAVWFLVSGITTGFTILFKQNFGTAIIVSNLFFFLASGIWRRWQVVLIHLLGVLIVLLSQFIYFVQTNSLDSFISDMRYLLFEQIIEKGVLNSLYPWQYPGNPFYIFVKTLFYLLPGIAAVTTLGVLWKKRKNHLLYIPLLTFTYYVLSIRPTTDMPHLEPLLALSSLSLGMVLHELDGRLKYALFSTAIGLVVIGAYHGFLGNYYKWHTPLISQNYYWNNVHAKIWGAESDVQNAEELKRYFDQQKEVKDSLFVYSFHPYLYVLLEKQNPTKYDYVHSGVLSDEIEDDITNMLAKRDVKHIIADNPIELDKSTVASFIQETYKPVLTSGIYTVWEKR